MLDREQLHQEDAISILAGYVSRFNFFLSLFPYFFPCFVMCDVYGSGERSKNRRYAHTIYVYVCTEGGGRDTVQSQQRAMTD